MKNVSILLIIFSVALQPFSRWIHINAFQQQHYVISSEQVVKDRSTVFCGSTKAVFQKMQEEQDKQQKEQQTQQLSEYPVYTEIFSAVSLTPYRNSVRLFPAIQFFHLQQNSKSVFHPPAC
ncbi:hypothetical protein [Sediminibacterium goheungense]|uniref:Uncharacterized protein n=1 Tax=Sediminibacterium goheungense TaxID=1086393 RepID=A0A4R6IW39_9BACT|nr:hypothetical protein [Sediminibacterium goheungense]TDO26531.1 hypothetical protein BC659_1838 [Sediminibacterium goheungense]